MPLKDSSKCQCLQGLHGISGKQGYRLFLSEKICLRIWQRQREYVYVRCQSCINLRFYKAFPVKNISIKCTMGYITCRACTSDISGRMGFIPSIRRRYCSAFNCAASSESLGQLNLPASSRLYNRRKPVPSHTRPFILSLRLPQNRNSTFF